MQETWVWSLDQEDPREKGIAAHSSILAWRISWTEEHSGLQSVGSQRVRHDSVTDIQLLEMPIVLGSWTHPYFTGKAINGVAPSPTLSSIPTPCHHTSVVFFFSSWLPLIRTLVMTFKVHPVNSGDSPHLKILNWIPSAKSLFTVRWHWHALVARTWTFCGVHDSASVVSPALNTRGLGTFPSVKGFTSCLKRRLKKYHLTSI